MQKNNRLIQKNVQQNNTNIGNRKEPLRVAAARGVFWTISGTGALALLRFISLVVLARLLDPQDFGVMAAALVVVGLSKFISEMGVGPAIVQRKVLESQDFGTALSLSMIFGGFLCLTCILISDQVALFFDEPAIGAVLRALAVVFLIRSVSVPSEALLQRRLELRRLVRIEVASYALGYLLVAVTCALAGLGVWSLVFAYLGDAFLRSLFLAMQSEVSLAPSMNWRSAKSMLTYGGGLTVGRLVNFLALKSDNIVIGRALGADALGLYDRVFLLVSMPADFVGRLFVRVLFPSLSRIQDNVVALRENFARGLVLISLVSGFVAAILIVLGPEIVDLVLGSKWKGTASAFQILGCGLLFRCGYKHSEQVVKACGKAFGWAWRQLVYGGAVVAGAVIGVAWGLNGVAIGVTIAVLVNYILMLQMVRSLAEISVRELMQLHVKIFVWTFACVCVSTIATMAVRQLEAPGVVTLAVGLASSAFLCVGLLFLGRRAFESELTWSLATLRQSSPTPLRRLFSRRNGKA